MVLLAERAGRAHLLMLELLRVLPLLRLHFAQFLAPQVLQRLGPPRGHPGVLVGSCLALGSSFSQYTPGFLPGAWTFQRCTDLVMAFSVPTTSRMFLSCASGFTLNCAPEGLTALRAFCNASFGVHVPEPAELQDAWGEDWTAAGGGSQIVFSNGGLDPWSYGGVQPDDVASGEASGPLVLTIEEGAHHLDLRGPNPSDPPSVVRAREQEAAALSRWIGL